MSKSYKVQLQDIEFSQNSILNAKEITSAKDFTIDVTGKGKVSFKNEKLSLMKTDNTSLEIKNEGIDLTTKTTTISSDVAIGGADKSLSISASGITLSSKSEEENTPSSLSIDNVTSTVDSTDTVLTKEVKVGPNRKEVVISWDDATKSLLFSRGV